MGDLVSRWLFLPRLAGLGDEERAGLGVALARIGRMSAVGILVGLGLFLFRQVAEFRDPFVPLSEDVDLLLGSAWGTYWYAGVAAACVALVGFWMAVRQVAGGWALGTLAVLGLGSFPGFTGHASGVEGLGSLPVLADTLHVLAAGAWIGGLATVMLAERWWRSRHEPEGSLLPELVPMFSRVALVSVALLAASGVWAAWLQLPELSSLFTSRYGRLLITKLVLVGLVLSVGAVNHKRLSGRLGDPGGPRTLRRSAVVELVLANLVVLATALLVRTSPLGH